jgi:hypothetical protein
MSVVTVVASGPADLVRGHQVTVSLVLIDAADDEITPTSWTVALKRASSTVATASGSGAASWTVTAPATYTLADDYWLEWVFTLADATTVPYRQSASVCLSLLYATVRPADLITRYPRFSASVDQPLISTDAAVVESTLLGYIGIAFADLLDAIRGQGNRSHRILNAWALRSALTERALEHTFTGLSSGYADGEFDARATMHGERYAAAWAALSIDYAPAEGGPTTRRKATAALFAGGSFSELRHYHYQDDLTQRDS